MVLLNDEQSKLVSGMLQNADIASSILDAVNLVVDVDATNTEITKINNFMKSIQLNINDMDSVIKQDGSNIYTTALSRFLGNIPTMVTLQQNAMYEARKGNKMAANFHNTYLKLYSQAYLSDTYTSVVFDIREAILKDKAREYWLSVYRPANPSEALIMQQFIRGNCTAAQAAYYLGIKGVPEDLALWLYDSYENYPSIKEMCVASAYTEITDAQLNDAMKYSNITLPANKTFFLNYAHALQLRTELNQYLVQLKADYIAGMMTEAEFIAEVEAHKPNEAEAAQIVINVNKQKTRQLLNMEIQSRTWLYRKGVFGVPATDGEAELAFYYALIECNLDALSANALARFEACKLGYNWERE